MANFAKDPFINSTSEPINENIKPMAKHRQNPLTRVDQLSVENSSVLKVKYKEIKCQPSTSIWK